VNAPGLPLERLQRWMLSVVAHPGEVAEAIAAPAAAAELGPQRLSRVILPSRTLEPAQRLGIYHGMYLLRMQEALATDYPALAHFLGEAGFRDFVRDYVQVYPSRSYTLNRLGDHLPEFVRNAKGLRHQLFLEDLARLELAATEVFDEEQASPLGEAAIAAVREEEWERAVFEPVPAFRMLKLRTNANAYVQSLKDDAPRHPRPRRQETFVAVFRRDYAVYRLELKPAAYELLGELVGGARLGDAVALALRAGSVREAQLFRWFREWISGGVFARVRIAGD
jgi:hypothetical protein